MSNSSCFTCTTGGGEGKGAIDSFGSPIKGVSELHAMDTRRSGYFRCDFFFAIENISENVNDCKVL